MSRRGNFRSGKRLIGKMSSWHQKNQERMFKSSKRNSYNSHLSVDKGTSNLGQRRHSKFSRAAQGNRHRFSLEPDLNWKHEVMAVASFAHFGTHACAHSDQTTDKDKMPTFSGRCAENVQTYNIPLRHLRNLICLHSTSGDWLTFVTIQ